MENIGFREVAAVTALVVASVSAGNMLQVEQVQPFDRGTDLQALPAVYIPRRNGTLLDTNGQLYDPFDPLDPSQSDRVLNRAERRAVVYGHAVLGGTRRFARAS